MDKGRNLDESDLGSNLNENSSCSSKTNMIIVGSFP
jgi:hypothetical protein